ncbi:MAG: D-alanyl-D-alanine carboxypeptidase family protein [Inhella sp.]|jgi:D-alanyl-D-alanine carboxypeptidase (penicillin-binding protein 5/6)|uniref:D-alanyl-D-alanine carboxypeptidase family protein n=1 Tax=Inhella sp. TaxID=1921806 RepID=UPI0022CCFE88|nr:D-alanyl-D-alanine carboxypeptidase family protein [Inhella sp.]MCZ8235190.1 D-alanyl-D-alanine carboxypeptidase [Inhella sp.]
MTAVALFRTLALPLLAALTLVAPVARAQVPQPPEIAARQYLLLDVTSQQVLAERDADARVDPASLTKLMTAYVVFNALKDKRLSLEQALPVSQRAWDERKGGASVMFIDTTMTPKVEELLRGMIIQSGNDASVALAEGVSGSVEQFVDQMNRQVQAWGLKNTQFKNPTGMSEPGHYSSARDLAVIATRVLQDHPAFYAFYKERDFTYNKIRQENRNMLLARDASVDGMKTGYTEAAGYCLVSSAQRSFPNGNRRLLSVVLGTASKVARANESQKLLNWGFSAWDGVRLYADGQSVVEVPVWKGKAKTAQLGAGRALFVTVPRGEGGQLQSQVERTNPLVAPLAKGQRVGTLKVRSASGAPLTEVPLVVQAEVPEAGVFGRLWDGLRLWIQ